MLQSRLSKLSKRQNTFQEPAINVTPLIDVVFVLLISFIIVAPLLEKDTIELASSGGVASHTPIRTQEDTSGPITIHVLQDNTILISGKVVAVQNISTELADLKNRFPTARPQLFHDKKAAFGIYQIIKNSLECVGFSEMDVVLTPS